MISPPDIRPGGHKHAAFPRHRRRIGLWIAFYVLLILGAAASALLFGPLL